MSSQRAQAQLGQAEFEGIKKPVIYTAGASAGESVYHMPSVEDARVTTVCPVKGFNFRVTSYEMFLRRRNPTLCGRCEDWGGRAV